MDMQDKKLSLFLNWFYIFWRKISLGNPDLIIQLKYFFSDLDISGAICQFIVEMSVCFKSVLLIIYIL